MQHIIQNTKGVRGLILDEFVIGVQGELHCETRYMIYFNIGAYICE